MALGKWFRLTATMELLSSFCSSLLLSRDTYTACPAKSDEQKRLANTEHFGNNWKAARERSISSISLEVWEPHIQKLVRVGLTDAMHQTWNVTIDCDEVWETKHTKYLSREETRKHWDDLDITRLYWLDGKVQAAVVLKKYVSNPITHDKFTRPEYKIIDLLSRDEVLDKAFNENRQTAAHHNPESFREVGIVRSQVTAQQ